MVKAGPCFLNPMANKGMLIITRNKDNDIHSVVIWARNMESHDTPLSYSLTGIRNRVTPRAFIMPAIVMIIKFLNFRLIFILYSSPTFPLLLPLVPFSRGSQSRAFLIYVFQKSHSWAPSPSTNSCFILCFVRSSSNAILRSSRKSSLPQAM